MQIFSFCSVNFLAVLLSAALLVISAVVVVSVTTVFSASAAEDYAHQLTRAVVDGGRSRVSDYIGVARNVIGSTQFGFQSGSFPNFINNQSRGLPQETFMHTWSPMIYATNFRMTAIGAGFNDGTMTYCNVINSQTQKFFCEFTDPMLPTWKPLLNGTNAWQYTEMFHDYENGTRVSPNPRLTYTLFNPRTRPWYAPHITSGPYGPTRFTTVYLHFFQDYPIVGISVPIPNTTDHTLMGVALVAVDLRDLSIFLSELPATPGTATAIVDNDGILLGLSDKGPLFDIFPPSAVPTIDTNEYALCAVNGGTGNTICRRGPATCSMPKIRLLYALRPDFFGGGSPLPSLTARVELLSLKGGKYYVGTSAIANYTNLLWRLVTVIPEEDLTGEITKGRNLAIILAAVVAVAASVVSAVALWLLLKPLRALAERMLAAATLRDGAGGEAVGSRMAEICTIEDAFNTLFGQLMKARSFLPASLLAQLDAQGETDEDEDDLDANSHGHETQYTSNHNDIDTAHRTTASGMTSDGRSLSHRDGQNHADSSTSKSSKSRSSAVTIFGLGGAAAAGADQTSCNTVVRSKHVTVLCFNLVGFHAQVRADAAGALGRGYAALVETASEASRSRRGVLDSFHGDRFVITFNAAIGCGAHATAALHVAGTLVAAAGGRRTTTGVASGVAHVGNTGSVKARRFATVGPVYAQAAVLERLAKTVPAPLALMTRAVADDARHAARSVFVELVRLPGAPAVAPVPIASLVDMQQAKEGADEWMYELAATEGCSESSALTHLNSIFLELASSHISDIHKDNSNQTNNGNHANNSSSNGVTITKSSHISTQLVESRTFLRDKCRIYSGRDDVLRALTTCDRLLSILADSERMGNIHKNGNNTSSNTTTAIASVSSTSTLRDEVSNLQMQKTTHDLGTFYKDCIC